MATHQEIAGVSDQELVDRMVASHPERFSEKFWEYIARHITPDLPDTPRVADVGCGPGLLLQDLSQRFPMAELHGTDITPAMIDYAKGLSFAGATPSWHIHDVAAESLPFEDESVDLVTMVALLHVLADPFKVLAEIRRVLKPTGQFLLQDWIRTPLHIYLSRMVPADLTPEQHALARKRALALFPMHNKYAKDDWLWLLDRAGFDVRNRQELGSPHFCTFACSPENQASPTRRPRPGVPN